MDLLNIITLVVTLTALFSYANHRYLGLPVTIGVMLVALLLSLALILLDALGLDMARQAESLLRSIDFNKALLHGMISFLLFAGALHINLNDLMERKAIIGLLSTAGTLMSLFLVGTLTWFVLGWFNVGLPYLYCLLFGALISPTDPIAVLGILRTSRVPKSLEIKIAGESLFNDGIGIVAFVILLGMATGTRPVSAGDVGWLFAREAIGGGLFGFGMGYVAYRMLKGIDNYQAELLITIALVMGGYSLAHMFHVSGPIAIVVAGLLIGNQGRLLAMSENTRLHLDIFWQLVDEILNAVLFLLIGLEVLVLSFSRQHLLAALIIIPVVVLSRLAAVGVPVTLLRPYLTFSPGAIRIMTWAGLRGGISVALALSLPLGPERDGILVITYAVVIFSILVQGLTIDKLVKRIIR
jgi:Na+:H+ antiporter